MTDSLSQIFFKDVGKYPLLNKDAERYYLRLAKGGDVEALHVLVSANQRFVISVAKHFLGQGFTILDLVNEGNLGLIKAVDKYNLDSKIRFLSYAVWWIRQSIIKALYEKVRVVKAPFNRMSLLYKYLKKTDKGLTDRQVERNFKITRKELDELKTLLDNVSSFETPLPGTEGKVLGDVLVTDAESAADNVVAKKYLRDYIKRALLRMDTTDAKIVSGYFGLEDNPATLEDLAKKLKVSKERIRQRKNKALKRLQTLLIPYGGKKLLDCF